MNFVSHFYLDRQRPEALFAIGAATPDLLSIYNSGLRVKYGHVKDLAPEHVNPAHRSFLEGLHRHFFADRIFHSSPRFLEETKLLSKWLHDDFPNHDVPRKYFVAHILLELLMDKVLIAQDSGLLPAYYAHYTNAAPFRVVRQATEAIVKHELPNYEAFLQRFLDNQYLYHYQHHNHIVYILRRLLRRVRIEATSFLDDKAILDLMTRYEERLADIHEAFFKEIHLAEE